MSEAMNTVNTEEKELFEKFKPMMYCYLGSGMLTNDYNEWVAESNAKDCTNIALEYAKQEAIGFIKFKIKAMTPDKELETWIEKKAAKTYPSTFERDGIRYDATFYKQKRDAYKTGARAMHTHLRESHEKEVGELKAQIFYWKNEAEENQKCVDHNMNRALEIAAERDEKDNRIKELEVENEYWQRRCLLAEEFTDPDPLYLRKDEKAKFNQWQNLKIRGQEFERSVATKPNQGDAAGNIEALTNTDNK